MDWTVSEARKAFSSLLENAKTAPQIVYKRNERVAAVVDAVTFEEFQEWQRARATQTVEDAFALLRRMCDDGVTLSERTDRANAFEEMLGELSD